MKTSEGLLFSYILHDTSLNTETDIEEYLNDAGIDGEKFIADMKEKIRLKLQEQLYAGGEEFQQEYFAALSSETPDYEIAENELQFAFRKLDKIDEQDLTDIEKDKKKLEILKKLDQLSKNN
jgi:hypothetical protein